MNETLRRIRERGTTWSGMRTDVESYIRTCHVCKQLRKDGTGSHGAKFSVSVREPNRRIAMDSIGPLDVDIRGYKYILVFIDCMSRYVELFATRTVSAEECAEKLLEFYGRNGAPAELLSDNHKEFTNDIIRTFLRYTGTVPINSIPYSHEDNAIVERVIEEVRRHLAAFRLEADSTIAWSAQLPLVQYLLNDHINTTTGVKPRDIKFGLFSGSDRSLFNEQEQQGKKSNWVDRIVAVQRRLTAKVADNTPKARKQLDEDVTVFDPGCFVMVKVINARKGDVARTVSQGPYEVIRQEGNKVSLYDYRHEQFLKDVQVSRCRLYLFREGTDPRSIGANLAGKSIAELVLAHKGYSGKRTPISKVKVLVKWADEVTPRWEPLTNIRRTIAFVRYAQTVPGMEQYVVSRLIEESV